MMMMVMIGFGEPLVKVLVIVGYFATCFVVDVFIFA